MRANHAYYDWGETVIFVFRGNELLLRKANMTVPDDDVCVALGMGVDQLHCLSPAAVTGPMAGHVPRDVNAPDGFEFHKLRAVLAHLGETGALASRAFQVAEWVRTHRYCGVCASPMLRSDTELCFRCSDCGFSAYPRVSPA